MLFFLKELEEENITDCYYLDMRDKCYYLGDYTPRGGYNCSKINQLIANLKKSESRRIYNDYYYKTNAIKTCAEYISSIIDQNSKIVIIPIPPSKSKDDVLYDNRIMQIAEQVGHKRSNINVLEFVEQVASTEAVHLSDAKRPTPEQLQKNCQIFLSPPL